MINYRNDGKILFLIVTRKYLWLNVYTNKHTNTGISKRTKALKIKMPTTIWSSINQKMENEHF